MLKNKISQWFPIKLKDTPASVLRDRVSYVSVKDSIKFWLSNSEFRADILNANANFTLPFVHDTDQSLADRLGDMEREDYCFTGFHSGSEWLAVLSRTKQYWQPRLLRSASKSKIFSVRKYSTSGTKI